MSVGFVAMRGAATSSAAQRSCFSYSNPEPQIQTANINFEVSTHHVSCFAEQSRRSHVGSVRKMRWVSVPCNTTGITEACATRKFAQQLDFDIVQKHQN
jgi:hypothetical protein